MPPKGGTIEKLIIYSLQFFLSFSIQYINKYLNNSTSLGHPVHVQQHMHYT